MNRVDKSLSMGLVIGVVVSGALLSSFVAAPRVGERFTQFYVLGPDGKIEGYPTNLTLGENGTVILGVINHEYKEANYSISIMFDNDLIEEIDGIRLQHEERWEQNVTFTPTKVGENLKLEFLLYAHGGTEPYRNLHIWIIVNP